MSLLLRRHHKKVEDNELETTEEVEDSKLDETEEVNEEQVDFEELTVPELKELADDEEIEYKSNATRPQLIELLK